MRLARDEGAAITGRFKHENLPISGADCAASIEHVVCKVKGVLAVNVNYPTQKLKVQYDSTLTDRAGLMQPMGEIEVITSLREAPLIAQIPRRRDWPNQVLLPGTAFDG